MFLRALLTTCLLTAVTAGERSFAQPNARARSGFDLQRLTIPLQEIRSGGPPKDGIPAITNPRTVPAARAKYLTSSDRVIGVVLKGQARAYPLRILNQHEIVNDRLGGVPIAVTYCPLCDSAVVFDRRTPLGELEFGVSGLLYNSNVLMYDRQKQRLWSQMAMQGVSGDAAGVKLRVIPFETTTWSDWRNRHPEGDVLSDRTGFNRNYQADPYAGYARTDRLWFPVRPLDRRLPPKTRVLGVIVGEKARAYPIAAFGKSKQVRDESLAGKHFRIEIDGKNGIARVVEADDDVQWAYTYWFAWYAFHPNTEIVRNE
ncbi:MAG: DUF3179 domain-containing protein [Planctomycetota bacterium]|nr:MAG: DUF3179 domain-containing protein [Planctomycetota bacterium]